MPTRRNKKAVTTQTKRKPLKEVQPAKKASVARRPTKASVAVKTPRQSSSQTKHPRKASTAVRYSQDLDDIDMDIFDDSDSEDESSSEESVSDENMGDPSQIYETIERFPKQRSISRPTTSSNRPATPSKNSQNLFKLIQSDNYEKAVSSWVGRYQRAARTATTELINMIIQCSGSQRSISEEQFETVELTDVMEQFQTERYMKSGGDYPLKGSSKESIAFTTSFTNFWDQLLTTCRTNIIYDSYLMPSINAWLVTFSRSKLRPFRHVATLTSCQIVLSLSKIANSIREDLQQPQRLANAQRGRGGDSTSRLKKRLDRMHQQIMDIEYLINGHFSGVFKRRYRDRVSLIRKLSIKYLCDWMLSYSSVFVSDHYLKYIGWALSDRDAPCRLNAVSCLNKLCSVANLLPHMENFISFYHNRILKMPCDVDAQVSAVAIQLLSQLAENDYLEEADIKELFKLISDSNATIRYEAGKFIKVYQLDGFEEEERIADETDNQTYCRKFLEFVIEHTSQSELPEYIVDALWDPAIWEMQAPKRRKRDDPLGYIFLRDWNAMIKLLMPESGRDSELTSSEQAVLCRVMLSSVRKAMGEDIVPKQRGEHNIRESAARQKRNQNIITRTFVRTLGPLLTKFQADGEKVESLLPIANYFDLELLDEEQCKEEFIDLCTTVKELLLNRIEEKVFANCAKVFRHFLQDSNPFKGDAELIFSQLEDELYQKIEECVQMVEDLEEQIHHNGCSSIRNALARARQVYSIIPLKRFDGKLVEQISKILYSHLQAEEYSDEIRINGVEVLSCYILWQLCDVTKALKENPTERPDPDTLATIRRHQNLLVSSLEKFFGHVENSEKLRDHCFLKLLDMMTMFSPKLKQTALRGLAFDAGAHLQNNIKEYFTAEMEQQIDRTDEEEAEKRLSRKRVILTAIARTVTCFALPQIEFGDLILLHLLVHDDKKIDDIIKLFFNTIRKQNNAAVESRIVFKAIKQKFDNASMRGTQNSYHGYKEFATKLGSMFPHRKLECQDTLHRTLQAVFLEALESFPAHQGILDGLVMFASKLFPNRATRVASFCREAIEEQSIRLDDVEETSPVRYFLEYLEAIGSKKNVAELRKKMAAKSVAKPTEEDQEERKPVSSQTLKAVAEQFDIEYDIPDSDDDEVLLNLSDDEESSKAPSEKDKSSSNGSPNLFSSPEDSVERPIIDEYFLKDTAISQEVGRTKTRKRTLAELEDVEEPPTKRRKTKHR